MSTTDVLGTATASSSGNHLWVPDPKSSEPSNEPKASSSRSTQLLKDRIYVGNLGPVVDEYTLLQVFSKYGKVTKLDFLFHKSGPNKGRPRGYAFVEFENEAGAERALAGASGKLLRGRKLVVTFAHQAPLSNSEISGSYGGRPKKADSTPTALSIVKSTGVGRSEIKTSRKIAIMEAKLRQMESSSPFTEKSSLPPKPAPPANPPSDSSKSNRSRRSVQRMATQRSAAPDAQELALNSRCQLRSPRSKEAWRADSESSTVAVCKDQAKLSDLTKAPTSRRLSIPGVKITKTRPK
ncbi:hypothetical protein BKA82DRAFT_994339 [Pisolithus tinctorius]|uniref:Probable RNA-binding protein 18 n=1 Tax=Pisolithus tinctorius Marx 270 TaxID=870435 RepID=A0A0C3PSG6_PISTI|nr:hypothetical protein BKA82DRAFT_994339 [Pisolithus tinctorius]KIO11599.1 hypothetical protein M404DRAFT_994339 [Pisolithus tinctorius Marx 270]